MRKRNLLIPVLMTIMVCCGSVALWAAAKVQVCHIPPGDPANFHTITVSENALPAHLAHGDIAGGCLDSCEILCDDGDACTVDACDPVTGQCAAEHQPVDCDDGLYCTTDSCDPTVGCLYTPVTCTPPDLCTISTCSEPDLGACVDTPVACGPGEVCDPATGDCTDPCSGVVCEPTEQCLVNPGNCVAGDCFFDPAPDGTACDDGDPATVDDQCVGGVCVGTAQPPFISPTWGPVGWAFVILDPQGRLAGADRIMFTVPGDAFETGTPAEAFEFVSPFEVRGEVPQGIDDTGIDYDVTIHAGDPIGNLPLIDVLTFRVTASQSGPSISPTSGPAGWTFVILDPQGQLAGADRIMLTTPGDAFESGTPADAFEFVSAFEVRGNVPQGIDDAGIEYDVTVHAGDPVLNLPLIEVLTFTVTLQ